MREGKDKKSGFLRFFVPSLLGVILFLIPIRTDEGASLVVNLVIDMTKELMGVWLVPFVLLVLTISAVCSAVGCVKRELFRGYWAGLFCVKRSDCVVRIIAALLAYMIYFQVGPQWIWAEDTGTMMMNDVVSNLIPFFFWAGLFLPLLTEFGLMEFIGSLLRPVVRPLFRIPGRAAVNCAVSWVGSGSMGIVLTKQEYENGFYTQREAASIATGFSVASIAIVSLLSGFLDMTDYFPLIYGCCIFVGLLLNVIMVRIPPIRKIPESFYSSAPRQDVSEKRPEGKSLFGYALESAVTRAQERKGNILVRGIKITGDVWFTLEPIVLTVGTLATILVVYTPIVEYLALPLGGLLGILGIPEAAAAGQSILLGAIDIFLPFITGGGIASPMTRFILSVVCVLQIIYCSETGPLLLKAEIGLKARHVVLIFIERTILALFIVTPIAMIFF